MSIRQLIARLFFITLTSAASVAANASDACATRSIATHAAVSVSDGSSFETTTWFASRDAAAIRFGDAHGSTVVAEGPYAWAINDGTARIAPDAHKNFALGHQYHALLLTFDETLDNVRPATGIPFAGGMHDGRAGDFPAGGTAFLIHGATTQRPLGMRFELPDAPAIDTRFEDWRETDGGELPFVAHIHDGEREFEYRYTRVSIEDESPHWFRTALPAEGLDALQIYRLHRRLMAAHCLGDADLIADLSAPELLVASGGALHRATREQTRQQFTSLFSAVTYDQYIDLSLPHIAVAQSGDIGWVAANVRTVGTQKSNKKPLDTQWAWIMPVRKVDGVWLSAGNASNRQRD